MSTVELNASPPPYRWPGLRAGIEPDSEKNVELMLTNMRKILKRSHNASARVATLGYFQYIFGFFAPRFSAVARRL
jgi:hypothetical protein